MKMSDDEYCMQCGSKLDQVTGKCPSCDPHREGRVTLQTSPEHEMSGPSIKRSAPADSRPPAPDYNTTENIPPPVPGGAPSSPGKKGLIVRILTGIVLVVVVIFIILLVIGFLVGPPDPRAASEDSETEGLSSLSPAPLDTVPPGTEVYVQVERDPISDMVHITFTGGPGQKVLKELKVVMTRSDGQVMTGIIQPIRQERLSLSGTPGDIRVEVFAIYTSGKMYRLYDQVLRERSRA
jgi:membrane-associated protease RseP (regulator of RpoE activity)